MHDLIDSILSLPIGVRAALLLSIIFLLWLILTKPILKILSIVPWILKKLFWHIYIFFEIPISMLHRKYGNGFGVIDQGLTSFSEKICNFMDILRKKMIYPKTIFGKQCFVVYLILCAYLIIPIWTHLDEKPFTFWYQSYIDKETSVVDWMDSKGWIKDK